LTKNREFLQNHQLTAGLDKNEKEKKGNSTKSEKTINNDNKYTNALIFVVLAFVDPTNKCRVSRIN
jgi:hypothetical protein